VAALRVGPSTDSILEVRCAKGLIVCGSILGSGGLETDLDLVDVDQTESALVEVARRSTATIRRLMNSRG
jgi:hypothetical protein